MIEIVFEDVDSFDNAIKLSLIRQAPTIEAIGYSLIIFGLGSMAILTLGEFKSMLFPKCSFLTIFGSILIKLLKIVALIKIIIYYSKFENRGLTR